MKATDLLEEQHEEVSKLFQAIEASDDAAEKRRLFMELASSLAAHDAIERKIFYPACEETMGLNELLGEALVEHGVIEFSLYQSVEAAGEPDFNFKVKVLKELVEHHVKEEEEEFFPKAKKELGDDSLELLGKEMKAAFDKELESDFRQPLYDNLRQVLAGVLKPVPSESTPIKARKSA